MKTLLNADLLELFTIPCTYELSEGTARYYSSLTPEWNIIKQLDAVTFVVGFDSPPPNARELPHHNAVNTHLFKPRYFVQGTDYKNIFCIVPNKEVLAHALRSLAVIASHVGRENITVSAEETGQKYADYTAGWRIEDRVIFGWRDSFIKFLKVLWLLENNIELSSVKKLVQELENRLKTPEKQVLDEISVLLYREIGFHLSDFERHFNITYQDSSTPCISSANLDVHGVRISIVQLTWGRTLSQEMMQSLLNINPHVRRMGFVGGIGYAKNDDMQLDDIFLPEALVTQNDSGKFHTTALTNNIFNVAENTYFNKKRVSVGSIKTVVPQIGVLSNTASFKDAADLIDGFDMEFEGFFDVLKKYPSIEYASAHYIMDIPSKGYSLGDTYYHEPYLEKFFKTFNRGKYSCFERVLNFVTT